MKSIRIIPTYHSIANDVFIDVTVFPDWLKGAHVVARGEILVLAVEGRLPLIVWYVICIPSKTSMPFLVPIVL
jgi:hypothetical protein